MSFPLSDQVLQAFRLLASEILLDDRYAVPVHIPTEDGKSVGSTGDRLLTDTFIDTGQMRWRRLGILGYLH